LGLPITKRLVELHGGTLTIKSQVDIGTVVTVILPSARLIRRTTEISASREYAVENRRA
jgi:signal transduction histidine kinase